MKTASNITDSKTKRLAQVAGSCLKLGCIGFGGIAGVVATIEREMVIKRKWLDQQHFMDAVSMSYIIPGPNAVQLIMHCGKERAGRLGLIVAGICYVAPATLICLFLGFFYQKYSALPDVQRFLFGVRPAITALLIGTSARLFAGTLRSGTRMILLCMLVFAGSLLGLNEVLLILGAGIINYLIHSSKEKASVFTGLLFVPMFLQNNSTFSNGKLFSIFLKIGAVLYGSGFVLFAYMDESLVRKYHWLTQKQLMDAIAVGQITPGPLLSSATFAGYLINGVPGGLVATLGIFLPSFFLSLLLHNVLSFARKHQSLRAFLDGLTAASVSIIAVVGIHLLQTSFEDWRIAVVLAICLAVTMCWKKLSTVYIILLGSVLGFALLTV